MEWMDVADLDKIRKIAEQRGKSPAWASWESEMQRKSVIRRLCKRLPLGQDYFVAQTIEEAQESDNPTATTEVLDVLTDGEASRTEQQSQAARQMAPGPVSDEEAAEIIAAESKGS